MTEFTNAARNPFGNYKSIRQLHSMLQQEKIESEGQMCGVAVWTCAFLCKLFKNKEELTGNSMHGKTESVTGFIKNPKMSQKHHFGAEFGLLGAVFFHLSSVIEIFCFWVRGGYSSPI